MPKNCINIVLRERKKAVLFFLYGNYYLSSDCEKKAKIKT